MLDSESVEQAQSWFSLRREMYGNAIQDWLLAFVVFLAVVVLLRLAKVLLGRKASSAADKTEVEWTKTGHLFLKSFSAPGSTPLVNCSLALAWAVWAAANPISG